MIEMDQYELIRTLRRSYKKGIREIAKQTGHHRVTIRKALAGESPEYRRTKAVLQPVMGDHALLIDTWLRADQEVPRKQRHTAKRIYERLVEERNFNGGESTVRRFVRLRMESMGLNAGEAMVPLAADMGEAEMDWGEAIVVLAGERIKVKMFCMRSRYSGKPFVRLYRNERQQMLFDGHAHAFTYFGGVFPVIVYDNMKSVVKQVLKGRKRVEQRAFQQFRSHYTFESRFCNVASGNEKGGVEGLVKFSRQNFLVPIPEVASLEELNRRILEKCEAFSERVLGGREDQRPVGARAEEERQVLLPMEATYETATLCTAKINKYQMVQIDGNRYSVPGAIGKTAQVYLGCQKVRIYLEGALMAEHERSFANGRWVMNPCHYLKLLQKKVRGFENAKPIREWRKEWPLVYERLLEKLRERHGEEEGTPSFLKVLQLHEQYETTEVETAVELAWENATYHYEAIKMILSQIREDEERVPQALGQEHLKEKTRITVETPDTNKYNQLTGSILAGVVG